MHAGAFLVGAVVALTPVAAGVWTFFTPLLRKPKGGGSDAGFLPVATLDSLPADGSPRKFQVVADRKDAWNFYPNQPVGAVYLRKLDDGGVQALSVICPHAGCFVDLKQPANIYSCPCHESEFKVDGDIIPISSTGKQTVSPRAMDSLETRIDGQQILVKYQTFIAATHEKIVKS